MHGDTRKTGSSSGSGDELPPGTMIGPWAVEGVLGRGGMGVVYQGRHTRTNEGVAIKMLLQAGDPGLEKRLRREANVISRLDHPSVVELIDTGRMADGRPFIAMELVEGEDLKTLARSGDLEVAAGARLIAEVARAINHAHGLGVLHRDIKPANILVPTSGPPKILDFGLAKAISETSPGDPDSNRHALTAAGMVIGTFAYMAPEQLGESSELTGAADIYGLAASLYEVIAGRPPFQGASAANIISGILNREPDPPSEIRKHRGEANRLAARLDEVCLTSLAKEPNDRHETAAAFADAIERAIAEARRATRTTGRRRVSRGSGKISRTSSSSGRVRVVRTADGRETTVRLPEQSNSALFIAIGVGALLLVAVGLLAIGGGGEPPDPGPDIAGGSGAAGSGAGTGPPDRPDPPDPGPPPPDAADRAHDAVEEALTQRDFAAGLDAIRALDVRDVAEIDRLIDARSKRPAKMRGALLAWLALERAVAGDLEGGRVAAATAGAEGRASLIVGLANAYLTLIDEATRGDPRRAADALGEPSLTDVIGSDVHDAFAALVAGRGLIVATISGEAPPVGVIDAGSIAGADVYRLAEDPVTLLTAARALTARVTKGIAEAPGPVRERVERAARRVLGHAKSFYGSHDLRLSGIDDAGLILAGFGADPSRWQRLNDGIGLAAETDGPTLESGSLDLVVPNAERFVAIEVRLASSGGEHPRALIEAAGAGVLVRAAPISSAPRGTAGRVELSRYPAPGGTGEDLVARAWPERGVAVVSPKALYAVASWPELERGDLRVLPAPKTLVREIVLRRAKNPWPGVDAFLGSESSGGGAVTFAKPGLKVTGCIDRDAVRLAPHAWPRDNALAFGPEGTLIEFEFEGPPGRGPVCLVLKHLAALGGRMPSYAPVTASVNGVEVASTFSPNGDAGTSSGFFEITDLVRPGTNSFRLEVAADAQATHGYWFYGVEIRW